ncbi:hypothetical protein HZA97_00090 [Candidatus Woesearchaeota archaeon]|nr:hypothetical protein [Candidatus Woesearchaeota archaeon]
MVLLVAAIGSAGYYTVFYVSSLSDHVNTELSKLVYIERVNSGFLLQFQEIAGIVKNEEYISIDKYQKNKKEITAIFEEISSISAGREGNVFFKESNSQNTRVLLEQIRSELNALDNVFLETVRLKKLGKQEALTKSIDELELKLSSFKVLLDNFSESTRRQTQDDVLASKKTILLARQVLLSLTIFTSIFALILGIVLSRKITRDFAGEINRVAESINASLKDNVFISKLKPRKKSSKET